MATPIYSAGTWGDVIAIVDNNGIYTTPSSPNWATLVATVSMAAIPKPLSVLQAERSATIDANTTSLLSKGFTDSVSGLNFALDPTSQIMWLGLLTLGPAGALAFPVQITATDGTVDSWASWATLGPVTVEALTAFQTISGVGASLKSSIMAATTADAVNAVVDTR
jgi:hypothetical protein